MANKYESLTVKFNKENEQDMIRWRHIEKLQNKQAYIKDLIFLDLMADLFKDLKGGLGVAINNKSSAPERPVVEEPEEDEPDLSGFDVGSAIEFD